MSKLLLLLLCSLVTGYRPSCNKDSVLQQLRIATYDFSVRLLDKVAQETEGHFVFSPISTWLQLLAIADGAQGETLNEVLNVTRQNRICSRKILRQIFNTLDTELSETMNRRNILVIDKLLNIKKSFVNSVEILNAVKVIQADFNTNTAKLDEVIDDDTNSVISEMFHDNDFRMTVLLTIDIGSLKANWKSPFNPEFTHRESFYSNEGVKMGHVNMMNQIGSFNFNYIPTINAQAIELPISDRASMVLLKPTKGNAEDLFLAMQRIRMASLIRLLNVNGPRLVNLKVPRFNLTTDIDNVPEFLYDMGLKRMFSPHLAELKKITDYTVYVSMMANKFNMEVTEAGVSASVAPENIGIERDSINVSFDKPFVFLLMDKISNVILFAGVYSMPSLF